MDLISATFQCRTQHDMWCNLKGDYAKQNAQWFQCRTQHCMWCNSGELWRGWSTLDVSMPHAALWVVQPDAVERVGLCARVFQCRTRLFPFAPTTASRSPSPARAGEALLRAVFSQNHAILASPADAGEVASAASRWGRSCRTRLCGWCNSLKESQWLYQSRFNAARGFVGGATAIVGIVVACVIVSMPHAALWVVQHSRVFSEIREESCFNAARGFVGGATSGISKKLPYPIVSMPHAALWVVQQELMQIVLIPLAVSMPHAALWVVQQSTAPPTASATLFQCRTRLCGWCSEESGKKAREVFEFRCRTRLCGWCSFCLVYRLHRRSSVSMPHAALWVVQHGKSMYLNMSVTGFNAARGFVGGAASSLAALVPLRGKRPFGKSPEI